MFFGGFGTNWNMAKPVAIPSILMSSLGVIITSGVTGMFCHMVIGTSLLEGLLIGGNWQLQQMLHLCLLCCVHKN